MGYIIGCVLTGVLTILTILVNALDAKNCKKVTAYHIILIICSILFFVINLWMTIRISL